MIKQVMPLYFVDTYYLATIRPTSFLPHLTSP